jgi:hypothetical protein
MNNGTAELPSFPRDIYRRIALNDLVVYAVYFLSSRESEIIFEDVVAIAFRLFPERFHLRGYVDWPDSTVVNKRWLDCRAKGLLQGSTAAGFSLTPKGLELAERTGAILSGEKRAFVRPGSEKIGGEIRTRAGRFIRSVEASGAYKTYSETGTVSHLAEFDFRSLLLCTMESASATLRNNLEQFRQYATLYKRKDILTFLQLCAERFAEALVGSSVGKPRLRGGMNRQKVK